MKFNLEKFIPLKDLTKAAHSIYIRLREDCVDVKESQIYHDLSNRLIELDAYKKEKEDKIEKLFKDDPNLPRFSRKIYDDFSEESFARWYCFLNYFRQDSVEDWVTEETDIETFLDFYYTGWKEGIEWAIKKPDVVIDMYKNNDYVHSNEWNCDKFLENYDEAYQAYQLRTDEWKQFEENNAFTKLRHLDTTIHFYKNHMDAINVGVFEPLTKENPCQSVKVKATIPFISSYGTEELVYVDYFDPKDRIYNPHIDETYKNAVSYKVLQMLYQNVEYACKIRICDE